jgi:hypothetical protein
MRCEGPPFSLVTFWSGALIAIVAAAVGHFFSAWRERSSRKHAASIAKENRKQDFLGLLSGMRSEAERLVGQPYANVFPERIYQLRRETPKIGRDLDDNARLEFDNAVKALCQLGQGEVMDGGSGSPHAGQAKVTEAIDKIQQSLN